jgi:hypothetical protein
MWDRYNAQDKTSKCVVAIIAIIIRRSARRKEGRIVSANSEGAVAPDEEEGNLQQRRELVVSRWKYGRHLCRTNMGVLTDSTF